MGKLFLRDRLAYLACFRHVVSQELMQAEQEVIWKQLKIGRSTQPIRSLKNSTTSLLGKAQKSTKC